MKIRQGHTSKYGRRNRVLCGGFSARHGDVTVRVKSNLIKPSWLHAGSDEWRFPLKISARNVLKGRITNVTKGQTTTHIQIDVGGTTVFSAITNEAADELGLAKGQAASAVIKASDVMVSID
jgi:molybdopterin-binding protein